MRWVSIGCTLTFTFILPDLLRRTQHDITRIWQWAISKIEIQMSQIIKGITMNPWGDRMHVSCTQLSRERNTIINFVVVQISGAEAPEAKPMHQSYAKSNLKSLQLSGKWHFGQDKEINGCLEASAQCYEEWVEGSDMLLFIAVSVYHQDIAAVLLICCTWKNCTQWASVCGLCTVSQMVIRLLGCTGCQNTKLQ